MLKDQMDIGPDGASLQQGNALAASPLRVVICGEVSSGKSTVLNALIREYLVPDNLGADTRPAVSVSYDAEPGIDLARADGTRETVAYGDPDSLRGAHHITVRSRGAHLKTIDLFEAQVTTAEDMTEAQVELVRSADVLVWVTIASQAWRLSERKILDRLSEIRPRQSMIAITRADKLRSEEDRQKLMERVRRDTLGYFETAIFVHGSRENLRNSALSVDSWALTGGKDIFHQIETFRGAIRAGSETRGFTGTVEFVPPGTRREACSSKRSASAA